MPGSGKSTYAQKVGANTLSSDEVRRWLIDDPANQEIHRRVFLTLRSVLKQRLELRRPVTYVDATNLTPYERRPYVVLAGLFDSDIEAVFFDVPLEKCKRRNSARDRVVPDEAMDEMARRLTPPTTAEGFSRVTVITDC